MNGINRSQRIRELKGVHIDLESIESLNELIILYMSDIEAKLNNITKDPILQAQLKNELGITWTK